MNELEQKKQSLKILDRWDFCFAVGLGSVLYGVGQFSAAVAWILFGLVVVAIGIRGSMKWGS